MESESENLVKILLEKNGPLVVEGLLAITDSKGIELRKSGKTALCRCGKSELKPLCDGSHKEAGFVAD